MGKVDSDCLMDLSWPLQNAKFWNGKRLKGEFSITILILLLKNDCIEQSDTIIVSDYIDFH